MNRDRPWKRPRHSQHIELEPLAEGTPADEAAWGCREAETDDSPIPEKPLHLCPNCDYNLTGLISRRCPECGEDFSLVDARFRAREVGELGKDMRSIRHQDLLLALLGIVMGFLGLATCFVAVSTKVPTGAVTHDVVFTLTWFVMLFPIAYGVLKYSPEYQGIRAVFIVGGLMLLWGLSSLLI